MALRGADIVVQTLARGGVRHIFSLSGNHVMPIFDAVIDAGIPITHTRHEGAAVHMADAWGRLTGIPGIALLTGGPGHANGIGALYTALASDSPLVMISGHAPLRELGKGSFQEMRQADMAEPVVKASWTARSIETLAEDVARAMRIAKAGRPGPVHLSLPFDLLEASADAHLPSVDAFTETPQMLDEKTADGVVDLIASAERPLVLTGPTLGTGRLSSFQREPGIQSATVRAQLADALGVPVLAMESPRGLNDPALGALSEVVARADVIVLLGKPIDFTLRFAQPPAIGAGCRIAVIDPDAAVLERARKLAANRIAVSTITDTIPAAKQLIRRAKRTAKHAAWTREVEAAIATRPASWSSLTPRAEGPLHPVEIGRAVQSLIDAAPDSVFVSDGGEFGQWAQACIHAETRVINGQGGSIGSALPFAIAAKVARPHSQVIALTGDGSCGFHLLEIDTAVRAGLPLVVVVGNDACWNAEYQIQLRAYGKDRAQGCELLPARYDLVAAALGAHGELVTKPAELEGALTRAVASRRPALVNVMIERLPAPTVTQARATH